MPITPKRVNAEEKREAIIAATLETLAEKDLASLRMVDVAERLDMGKGTIYEYFGSRSELVQAALDRFYQDLYALPEEDDSDVLSFIHSMFADLGHYAASDHLPLSLIVDVFYHGIKADAAHFSRYHRESKQHLAERIRRGQMEGIIRSEVDPDDSAFWIGGLVDGLILQILLMPEEFDVDTTLRSAFAAVVLYLTGEDSPDCT